MLSTKTLGRRTKLMNTCQGGLEKLEKSVCLANFNICTNKVIGSNLVLMHNCNWCWNYVLRYFVTYPDVWDRVLVSLTSSMPSYTLGLNIATGKIKLSVMSWSIIRTDYCRVLCGSQAPDRHRGADQDSRGVQSWVGDTFLIALDSHLLSPELLRVAVSQADPELLRAALTHADPKLLERALTEADPDLLRTALRESRPENLIKALTSSDSFLLSKALTRSNSGPR